MLKGIVLGIILCLIGVFAGAYFYFSSGQVPVATSSPEMPLERKFAGMALHAYLNKLPHPNSPVPADEPNLLAGAKLYKQDCAVCHGLPGEPRNAIGNGMFPKPPLLFRGMGVTDDEVWESYHKISGGIRLTGMPGFKDSLSETQMWQISQLLKNADKLPETVKAELAAGGAGAIPSPASPVPSMPGKAADEEHDHDHVH